MNPFKVMGTVEAGDPDIEKLMALLAKPEAAALFLPDVSEEQRIRICESLGQILRPEQKYLLLYHQP